MKPKPDKLPGKGAGLTWGRRTDAGVVTYRLFRRDRHNRVHMAILTFQADDSAGWRAQMLRRKCRDLRDQVDEIDLALLEIAA